MTSRFRRHRPRRRAETRFSSAEAWKMSLTSRNSADRPTNGASSPAARPMPRRCAETRSARQSWHRLALALKGWVATVGVCDRGLGRPPRRLADEHGARRRGGLDARRGVDEVARDHALVGRAELTAASPVRTPARAWRAGSSAGIASTSSSAARTARSASSSFATGAPQTAMTASPMNFSTVPP